MTVAVDKQSKEKAAAGEEPDFRQMLQATLDQYEGNQSGLARALGLNPGTVNSWFNGTRLPGHENLRRLAGVSPYSFEAWAKAAGQKVRAPLDRNREEYILGLWQQLTETEQNVTQTQMEALARARGDKN